ncbi:unnamed protein product [Mycena citricolor]|uniref:Uncharacterized protein n=1 Tax=Mycena citricolor TaxID=2018698 RepID=A0AAD2HLD5_9AGAR|nr:unnamed protein product [Mycena citricolor]
MLSALMTNNDSAWLISVCISTRPTIFPFLSYNERTLLSEWKPQHVAQLCGSTHPKSGNPQTGSSPASSGSISDPLATATRSCSAGRMARGGSNVQTIRGRLRDAVCVALGKIAVDRCSRRMRLGRARRRLASCCVRGTGRIGGM